MQDVVSDSYKGNPKKFWSYIKSTGQESAGVSPLKNEDGSLKSDNQSKANCPQQPTLNQFSPRTRKSIDGNETSQKKRIKCLPVKP